MDDDEINRTIRASVQLIGALLAELVQSGVIDRESIRARIYSISDRASDKGESDIVRAYADALAFPDGPLFGVVDGGRTDDEQKT